MARKLEAFPAAPFASKYPWDQLLDGEPWECMQGEDFESRLGTFLANARAPPADPRAPRVPRGPRANDGGQPDRTRSSSRDVRSAALGRSVHLESAPTTPSGPTRKSQRLLAAVATGEEAGVPVAGDAGARRERLAACRHDLAVRLHHARSGISLERVIQARERTDRVAVQDVRTGNRIGRIQEMTLSPIRPDRPGDLTSERGASTRTTNNGHTRSSRDERLQTHQLSLTQRHLPQGPVASHRTRPSTAPCIWLAKTKRTACATTSRTACAPLGAGALPCALTCEMPRRRVALRRSRPALPEQAARGGHGPFVDRGAGADGARAARRHLQHLDQRERGRES